MAHMVKNLPAMRETCVRSLGWEDPLEEVMANHSSILAWRIPWTGCYSHTFQETNSLRRTMQIVECSLLPAGPRQSLLLAKDPDQHL